MYRVKIIQNKNQKLYLKLGIDKMYRVEIIENKHEQLNLGKKITFEINLAFKEKLIRIIIY